jgi:hypothetical protein
MIPFLAGMVAVWPWMLWRSILNGRIFAAGWWDFHWRMFVASRLRHRNGAIVWRATHGQGTER